MYVTRVPTDDVAARDDARARGLLGMAGQRRKLAGMSKTSHLRCSPDLKQEKNVFKYQSDSYRTQHAKVLVL